VAATPRFRATQRRTITAAARHAALLIVVGAVVGTLTLVPSHADAAWLIAGLNGAVALVAVAGYAALSTRVDRVPEVVVMASVVAVDAAVVALGVAYPRLGIVSMGYLLLLPTIVALVIPWATRIHVSWLVIHATFAIAYAALIPPATLGGERVDRITLLVIAIVASQSGHLVNLRARALAFVQIQQIRALNRQAGRDRVRLDRLHLVLAETARTDELTGLKNRRSLAEALVTIRAGVKRYGDRYGILMLDLDQFKGLNDGLGHVEGDRILRTVANTVRSSIRPDDGAFRYGGEEFTVVMRIKAPGDAAAAAERIRAAIEGLAIRHPTNPPFGVLTVSVGYAVIAPPDLETTDETWLDLADDALYRAKGAGRNRTEAADPAIRPP
jgi:diguanylate cyclase (GGDEF)-like protein